ncbi:MAG TPA: hypothetical protein VM533_01200 [Fimbriiglobus sp.]|nr:hypothetical protein [Fimbriiglobus sp.]
MDLDLRKVAAYVRRAETEELLDRVTVYRDGMEPAAVDLMEYELARRGLSPREIEEHDRARRETVIMLDDRTAMRCSFCDRPAVVRDWAWHRLWGRVPVFPRRFAFCTRCQGRGAWDEKQEENDAGE